MQKKNDFIIKLNDIRFKSLDMIQVGDAFILKNPNLSFKSTLKNLIKIVLEIFTTRYEFNKYNKKEIIFFFSTEYFNREEHRKSFYKVSNCCLNKYVIECKQKRKVKFLHNSFIVFKWLNQMKRKKFSYKEAIYVIPFLIEIKKILDNINFQGSKGVIVFCDALTIDNMLVQFCNSKNIKTCTLQHGIYSRLNSKVITNSPSNYMLVYGESTKKECSYLGMSDKKIRIVGMPKLINEDIVYKVSRPQKGIIGVVFDGSSLINSDLKMINIINQFALKNNYKVFIKLHPGTNKEKYNLSFYKSIYKVYYTEISIDVFLESVEYIICCGSTVLVEALLKMIPVFLYHNEEWDVYPDIYWNKFKTNNDLEYLINYYSKNINQLEEKMISTRTYITKCGNVGENYINFFNFILKENCKKKDLGDSTNYEVF